MENNQEDFFPLEKLPDDELRIVLSLLPLIDVMRLRFLNSRFDAAVTRLDKRLCYWHINLKDESVLQYIKQAQLKMQNDLKQIFLEVSPGISTEDLLLVLDTWRTQLVGLELSTVDKFLSQLSLPNLCHFDVNLDMQDEQIVAEFIDNHSSTLQSFSFSHMLNENTLDLNLKQFPQKLKYLSIMGSRPEIVASALITFGKTVTSLQLDASSSYDFCYNQENTDKRCLNMLEETIKQYHNIQHLYLNDFDDGYKFLAKLPNLKTLVVDRSEAYHFKNSVENLECLILTDETEMEDPVDLFCPKLKHLVFSQDCHMLDWNIIENHKDTLQTLVICPKFNQHDNIFRMLLLLKLNAFPMLTNLVLLPANKELIMINTNVNIMCTKREAFRVLRSLMPDESFTFFSVSKRDLMQIITDDGYLDHDFYDDTIYSEEAEDEYYEEWDEDYVEEEDDDDENEEWEEEFVDEENTHQNYIDQQEFVDDEEENDDIPEKAENEDSGNIGDEIADEVTFQKMLEVKLQRRIQKMLEIKNMNAC